VRSLSAGIVVALIDAGADAGRRIELSTRGERFTTILHEIVRLGRTVALAHAVAKGTSPNLRDSDGAMPLHVVDGNGDSVNPEMVRELVRAGAAIDAAMPSGAQPIDHAACRILPATVAAMVELGADPAVASTRCCPGGRPGRNSRDSAPARSPTSSTSCEQAGPR
jgi:ankyrin repeat protein